MRAIHPNTTIINYPFGMRTKTTNFQFGSFRSPEKHDSGLMDGRSFTSVAYRYSFNGKEKITELNVNGNNLDFGARIYDSRIGRWMSVDGKFSLTPDYSPYNFTFNNPLVFVDPDGNYPVPKTFWQRIWNIATFQEGYNEFIDYKNEMELKGVVFTNIEYTSSKDISFDASYTVVKTETFHERQDEVVETIVRAHKYEKTNSFGYGKDNEGESLWTALENSVPTGFYNKYTGRNNGSGELGGNDIIYETCEAVATAGTSTALKQGLKNGIKSLAKREAREEARKTITFNTKRAAMRQAKRDAGIPTSQTYSTRTKHNEADKNGSRGIDYEFDMGDGRKGQIQDHPDGYSWDKYPHLNNHPYSGQHYKYK